MDNLSPRTQTRIYAAMIWISGCGIGAIATSLVSG